MIHSSLHLPAAICVALAISAAPATAQTVGGTANLSGGKVKVGVLTDIAGGGSDGVIAKRLDLPYQAGNRDGMQKIKRYRSADCVIGGFRYGENLQEGRKVVGSVLLGLYDAEGLLHHVGFSSAIKTKDKPALTDRLEAAKSDRSFTGNAPGGPSRWSTRRSSEWQPVNLKYVVEVSYDHFTGGRFRHGTSILRWRPDKKPRQCTFEQVDQKIDRRLMVAIAPSKAA
jgi:ATP-dependent DNA ligase